jgi:hypothetical protein
MESSQPIGKRYLASGKSYKNECDLVIYKRFLIDLLKINCNISMDLLIVIISIINNNNVSMGDSP